MAIRPQNRQPAKSLVLMLVITLGLLGFLGAVTVWGEGSWRPKLGLDLEGGQQIILNPQVRDGQTVNQEQLAQAVDIIRARVDGQGVAEAEVATLGDSVTVSIPGRFSQVQREALQRSSQMRFRPVLAVQPLVEAQGLPTTQPTGPLGPLAPSPSVAPKSSPTATKGAGTAPTPMAAGPTVRAGGPGAGVRPAATATPTGSATTPAPKPSPSAQISVSGGPSISSDAAKDPKKLIQFATDEKWATPATEQLLQSYDCRKQPVYDPAREDLSQPIVSCDVSGAAKYLLGPAVLNGSEIADANAGPETNQQGQPTGGYVVNLRTTGEAAGKYAEVSRYMVGLAEPRNQLAVVLDNAVISAPRFQGVIPDGQAQITGDFTAETAKLLADQLKFGALPMSFAFQSGEDISPTLGGDQLQKGILAGIIGLLLVVVYSLFQYRALGLVTVASLVIVAVLTYLSLTLLGWSHNLRLTMAGITGAIVAIGTTADSFIVYFERVRDEVRDGRRVRAAVDTGWKRARRTILISDAVNFLAAAVLYVLASSNVRGFAFMLMLTTILDVLVTFLFTHPLLSILATTRFFGGGHKWSGFDPERLGVSGVRYKGRGRVTVEDRRGPQEKPEPATAGLEGSHA